MSDEASGNERAHDAEMAAEDEALDAETAGDDPVLDPEPPARPVGGMARTLLHGTFWQALAQFAPLVINLVLTPYIIHGLGIELYGVYFIVNAVQALLGTFNGGIGPGVQRYLTIYAGRGDTNAATRLVVSMSVVVVALVVVVLAVFLASVPTVVGFFPAMQADPDGAALLLGTQIGLLGLLQLRALFQAVLFAQHRFAVTSIAQLLGHVVYTIGLVITVESGAGLAGIAWTFVAQQTLGTIVIVPQALRYLSRRGIGFIERPLWREFFGYAGKVQISSWIGMLGQQADAFIIGKFRAPDLPYYGPGQTFAQQLRTVPLNAVGPMEALLGRAVGERGAAAALEDCQRLQRMWVRGVVGFVAVGAPASFFGVTAWLHLGSSLPGIVTAILLLAHLFSLLPRVQIIWCLVLRRAGFDLEQSVVYLVVKVVLTLLVIGPFGAIGAVCATAFAQLVANTFLTRRIARRLDPPVSTPWRDVAVLPALAAGLLALVCSWGAFRLVGTVVPYGATGLLLCGLAAAPAFLLYLHLAVGLGELRRVLRRG